MGSKIALMDPATHFDPDAHLIQPIGLVIVDGRERTDQTFDIGVITMDWFVVALPAY